MLLCLSAFGRVLKKQEEERMILVFVGAGGSAAIDPEQYPDTQGFFDNLPGEIQGDPLFSRVVNFLKGGLGKEQIDIEDIMSSLDQFQTWYRAAQNPRTLINWIIQGVDPIGGGSNMSNLDSMEKTFVDPLNKKIREHVYKVYGKRPHPGQLLPWVLFLRELKEIDPLIEIFTTNYDRILERIIEKAGINVITGFTDSPDGKN